MPASKTFLKKWVKALRSGEFKQHTGSLQKKGTKAYCCLGVACRLMARETGKKAFEFVSESDKIGCSWSTSSFAASGMVGTWLLHTRSQKKLADMNDGVGGKSKSFAEIADYIEKTYIKKK